MSSPSGSISPTPRDTSADLVALNERLSTLEQALAAAQQTHQPHHRTIDSGMPSAATIHALGLPTFQADSSPTLLLPPSASIRPPPLVPTHPTALPPAPLPPAPTTNPLAGFPDVPSIPPKLLDTILSWQYTDLSELLPDQLRSSSLTTDPQIVLFPQRSWESQKKRKRQIIDIATWVQLYSTYILILSSRHPQALPELIAYQLFIVKAAKKFRYPSWLYYDTEYRKWAATTHCQEWSTINTQLYSLAFTGQGNPVSWCPICQVDGGNHTFDCPRYPIPTDPLPPQHPPSQPRSLLPPAPKRPRPPGDYCINYNMSGGNCKYGLSCRYPHKCSVCGVQGHPRTHCPNKSHQ